MKITNNTTDLTLDFVVKGKPTDGVPPTKSLAPGETADLDVSQDDVTLKGRILSGLVTVPARVAEKAASAG